MQQRIAVALLTIMIMTLSCRSKMSLPTESGVVALQEEGCRLNPEVAGCKECIENLETETFTVGKFKILTPETITNHTAPLATWETSPYVADYEIALASQADCQEKVKSYDVSITTELALENVAEGAYFLCAFAKRGGIIWRQKTAVPLW